MGSAGVLDVRMKVSTHRVQQVVASMSSRPVFTGPGSIPRRTECFPTQATASPCAGEAEAWFWKACAAHPKPCCPVVGHCLLVRQPLSGRDLSPKTSAAQVTQPHLARESRSLRRMRRHFWPDLMPGPRVLQVIRCFPLGRLNQIGGAACARGSSPRGACFGDAGSATLTFAEIAWPISAVVPPFLLPPVKRPIKVQCPVRQRRGPR